MAGLRYSDIKANLATVVDNGIDPEDPRVMMRTNEATQELLSEIIPVGGMITANVTADNNSFILLPKEMEAAYDATLTEDGKGVYSNLDVRQGFNDIINNFTYLDPSFWHDNPLIDAGLVADPGPPPNQSVLRRKYQYPGVDQGTIVQVTGPKRYLAITADDDFPIIQNVPALKLMIQGIEARENRDFQSSQFFKNEALNLLRAEVKKHQLDPRNFQRRRASYEIDLNTYPAWTKGWVRARIALEQPGAMLMGKIELDRLLERAEMTLIELGVYKGTIEEFDAEVFGGEVTFPNRVESVLAVSLCGEPLNLRSIFFEYLDNGPGGWDCTCGGYVKDMGEELIGQEMRRKYRVFGTAQGMQLKAVCKLRWLAKEPGDFMVIRNLEALRCQCDSLILQQKEMWGEATAATQMALLHLERELKSYLSGIKKTIQFNPDTIGMQDLGEML